MEDEKEKCRIDVDETNLTISLSQIDERDFNNIVEIIKGHRLAGDF